MTPVPVVGPAPPPPPYEGLHERLTALAQSFAQDAPRAAAALQAEVDAWWHDQQEWNRNTAALLSLHHEINNALVGVRGNAQLLMIGPAAGLPGVRERLEVVIRESERIQQAAARVRGLKVAIGTKGPDARAA